MKIRDYEWGFWQMMSDNDYMYTSMIRDIYFQGQTLKNKYKYIRYSLTFFLIGLIVAVLSFVGIAIWYGIQ